MTRLLPAAALLPFLACSIAHAQLSPGPLSRAHESLDSPVKCASCHEFGAGAPRFKCAGCHRDIGSRIEARGGYHGRVAKGLSDCARCHAEHYGREFNIIKWPTTRDEFDHRLTGWPLTGRHARLPCARCHNPKNIPPAERARISTRNLTRTLLGLSQRCGTCHDDVHRGQLGTECRQCHSTERWKPAGRFDHSTTRFPLTGKHEGLACAKCHTPAAGTATVRFKGLPFDDCSDCHRDVHRGAFQGACRSCHDTASWRPRAVDSTFDHSRTKFPLEGRHQGLACARCHRTADFSAPVAHARCLDCHADKHRGQFAERSDRGDCGSCHTVAASFEKTTFTREQHAGTRFPLTDAHAKVDCGRCHPGKGEAVDFHPQFSACRDCHEDVHAGQFAGRKCDECHGLSTFRRADYGLSEHGRSRFPLTGAHAGVPCVDCHRADTTLAGGAVRYRFANLACEQCHADPHRLSAEVRALAPPGKAACETCHTVRGWGETLRFAHEATGYRLEGAHTALACSDCHRASRSGSVFSMAFAGTPRKCTGCHEDVHVGQFARDGAEPDCASCHNQQRWIEGRFDHDRNTTFPLTGGHRGLRCRQCHTQTIAAGGRTAVKYHGTPRECRACHSDR